jgi:hypothetical protein
MQAAPIIKGQLALVFIHVERAKQNKDKLMPNHLIHENSPYLLQHANNPVDWYPWGDEALNKARAEDKPIFLSIGYHACHWCHVMAHESFEDPEIAALLNEHFINVKVDREERPDLDNIYMQAVVAMTGQGGWPMSVFLTPQMLPFYGGTYFPPVRRHSLPSFKELLITLARIWQTDRSKLLQSGAQLSRYLLSQALPEPSNGNTLRDSLQGALSNLKQNYDWENGGWGSAPKFPQPMSIEFLLQQSTRGDKEALDMAMDVLRKMGKGGMYDVIGGGFSRYSTDNQWHVPHFEKMLYDNAQLSQVYLHGWLLSGEDHFRQICEETLDFVARELRQTQGGFFSSLDADSEGVEGKYYLWTASEIQGLLSDTENKLFSAAYRMDQAGALGGKIVLQRAMKDEELAELLGISLDEVQSKLKQIQLRLLAIRETRCRPAIDDKIIVAWNALMSISFAEAGRYLNRLDYLKIAQQNISFLINHLKNKDRLMRSWREGQAKHNAYLDDYSALTLALIELFQSDGDVNWFIAAKDLTQQIMQNFANPEGGFFDTRHDHETLLIRPRNVQDNATPSGSALAVLVLLKMAALEGNIEWRSYAEAMLDQQSELMVRYPTAFSKWLQACDFAMGPVIELALLGCGQDEGLQKLQSEVWEQWRPRIAFAAAAYPPDTAAPALLMKRKLLNGHSTAYLCQDFACQQPVNAPGALRKLLDQTQRG